MKRFKWVDCPDQEPSWFDTREELDRWVEFLKACPVDDGPLRLRITEFSATKTEVV